MRNISLNLRPPWRRLALALGLASLAAGLGRAPARAGSYPETGRPVYLGMGGATFAGGSVDAGTGAALLNVSFGAIRSAGGVPVSAGFIYRGQDNSPGPFGPGTAMTLDWFLQPVQPGTLAPVELVGPGNRRFAFSTQNYPYPEWTDTRDPEMAGAVLHIPNPPNQDGRNWLVWKDGTTWYFLGGGSNGLAQIVDPHGNTVVTTQLRDVSTGICTQVQLTYSTTQRTILYTIPWAHTQVGSVTLAYDGGGSGSPNRTWTIAYDINNRLSSITDPTGAVTSYTWTTYNRDDGQTVPLLASITNARGNLVYANQYDSLGRVVKQSYADGGYLTASYPAGPIGTSGVTTVTDPRGGVRSYGCVWEPQVNYRLEGYHFANFTDALGRVTQWNQLHSGSFLDTQILDYRNRATTLNWDYTKGNLTSRSWTTPLSQTATQSWAYDPTSNACTSATDPLGRTTANTVSAAGDVMTTTDPRGNMTSVTRDGYGNATAITNPLSQTTNMTYGPYSEPLTTTDPLNHTTTRTFDTASRLRSVQDANGKTVSYTYDLMDRLLTASETVNGQVLTTTYVYDADGNRVKLIDPKNQTWSWSFDNMDRVSQSTDPLSKSATYSYDHNSNVTGITDRVGNTVATTFDAANRPLTKAFTYFGGRSDSTVTYNYDGTTHLLTSVVDSAAPGSHTWSYSYDALDRRVSVVTPYGTVSVGLNDKINRRETLQAGSQALITYGYDSDDDLVSILQSGATATLTYDQLDRLTQQTLPTTPNPVTTAWSFDTAGRLSSVTSTRSGTGLDSHTYTRDAVGNITQEVITGSSNSTSTFGYDDLYRLSSATVAGTAYSWLYDAVGNRTSQTVGGTTTTYTVDGADHLTAVNGAAVTSDANGNVTQDETGGAYSWDVRGRLVGLTKGGKTYAFQYGPDGLRLNKSVGGVLTTYLLDGSQVVTDTIGGSAYQTLYGPGTDHPLARNGEFFLPNSLGSTSLLTDSSGNAGQSYQYSPFGSLLNSPTDNNPFQFTGRENDGSGLLYYRARYYNPGWGRFVSADPAGFGGGINPYVYAGNNPVNFGDASGEMQFIPGESGVGGGHLGGGASHTIFDGSPGGQLLAGIGATPAGALFGAPDSSVADEAGEAEAAAAIAGAADTVTADMGMPENNIWLSAPDDDSNPAEAGMDYSDANAGMPDEPGSTCFPAGTPILTRTGARAIERLAVGDEVLSADPATGKPSYEPVEKTIVLTAHELLKIVTADGRSVEATPVHPFWVQGKGFVAAKLLVVGNQLKDARGHLVKIARITARRGKFTVYNFRVAKTHTYYANGLWVHNPDCTDIAVKIWVRKGNGWVYRLEGPYGWLGGPDQWHFHDVFMDDNGTVFDPMQGYPNGIELGTWLSSPTLNAPYPDAYTFAPVEPGTINSRLP